MVHIPQTNHGPSGAVDKVVRIKIKASHQELINKKERAPTEDHRFASLHSTISERFSPQRLVSRAISNQGTFDQYLYNGRSHLHILTRPLWPLWPPFLAARFKMASQQYHFKTLNVRRLDSISANFATQPAHLKMLLCIKTSHVSRLYR